jgi:hypothetical protein
MNWSMPRPALQVVASLLGAACLGAFALGVVTAPPRGRLPGEQPAGATGQVLQAKEATPLGEDRIEGAPEPTPLTPEEKAKLEEEKKAKAAALALAKAEADKGAPVGPEAVLPLPPTQAPPDKIGEVLEKQPAPPKPEDPPF